MAETVAAATTTGKGKKGWLGISKTVWWWIGGTTAAIILLLLLYYMWYIPSQKEKEIAKVIADIRANAAWFAQIQTQATANSRTVDQELRVNAIWVLQQPNNSPGGYDYTNYV